MSARPVPMFVEREAEEFWVWIDYKRFVIRSREELMDFDRVRFRAAAELGRFLQKGRDKEWLRVVDRVAPLTAFDKWWYRFDPVKRVPK